MAELVKRDFIGGINQQSDATRVNEGAGQFYLLMNGRVRRNVISPIRKPRNVSPGIPSGAIMQGAYAVNSLQIVFAGGRAYWKNFDPEGDVWQPVSSFQMSTTADRIYMEKVPSSDRNFRRSAVSASDVRGGVTLSTPIRGTPQCAVCCDGENQPWAIYPNASARRLKTYSEWNSVQREYVPIGIFPLRVGSKLYMVGKDQFGYYNQIYHSVSGRYLDFVVPVDTNGEKISSDEAEGGAPCMAYSFDFGNMTALARVPVADGAFFGSTVKDSYLVIPDYTPENMIYGEPVFSNQFLFSIGALNENCVVDTLGNTALIHYSGIRDFNAILTLLNEGKNSPFSAQIDELIANITQSYGAATTYDNYAVFAVQTRYGSALVWFDTLTQQFASIDQIEGIGAIKQFSVVQTKTARKLLFITQDNKLYEWEGSTDTPVCRVFIKDFLPEKPASQHALTQVGLEFGHVRSDGYVQIESIADGRPVDTVAYELEANVEVTDGQQDTIPYPLSTEAVGKSIVADFNRENAAGYRVGALIEWNADANLLELSMRTQEIAGTKPNRIISAPATRVNSQSIAFIGSDGVGNASRSSLNSAIKVAVPNYVIGLGDHAIPNGTDSEVADYLSAYWDKWRKSQRFFAVPGDRDLNTRNGEPFFQYMLQDPTRYFKIALQNCDVFMVNSGYNGAGTQIEPDNLDDIELQYTSQFQWLKRGLAESNDARRHNIVVWHHAPYTSASGLSGGLAALRNIPLRSWGARALICGHPKMYERLMIDDVVHYTVGTGGDTLASEGTVLEQSYRRITGVFGYLLATVYPLSIEFSFISVAGTEYDKYVLHL